MNDVMSDAEMEKTLIEAMCRAFDHKPYEVEASFINGNWYVGMRDGSGQWLVTEVGFTPDELAKMGFDPLPMRVDVCGRDDGDDMGVISWRDL